MNYFCLFFRELRIMKVLALLFLVGFASASFHDVLDEAADELLKDFMTGLENTPLSGTLAADEIEVEVKNELGKKLREILDHLLEKLKETIDSGKEVRDDILVKITEVREKMKDLGVHIGEHAKEMLEKMKGKLKEMLEKMKGKWKELLKNFLKELGISKRSIDEHAKYLHSRSILRDALQKLKKFVLSQIDKEALKKKIEELFGKGSELADQFLQALKEKGEKAKQKMLEMVDKLLGEQESRKRSIKELWDNVKNWFKDGHIELKEKFFKFGQWVKEQLKNGLDKGKTKIENIKQIAKEFLDHTKTMGKDIAVEALEFLRPYKDDLGDLWDQMKDGVKEILNREN